MIDFASDIYMNGLQFLPIYGFKRRTIIGFQIPITVITELISIHGIYIFYMIDFASYIYMNGLQFLPIHGFKRRTIIGFQIPITVITELISIHGI